MSIAKELKKLELMALYVNAVVSVNAIKKVSTASVYEPLLKSDFLSVDSNDKYLTWGTCTRLDKEIGCRLVYITLVEWSYPNEPDYSWYELKSDLDKCGSIIELKRKIRAMIKSPESFSTIDY